MSLNTTVPANITENNYSVPSFPSDAGLNTSVPAVVGDNYAVPSLPIESLSGKEDKSNKGIANGYAPLDATSKVPSGNLPANLVLTSDSRISGIGAGSIITSNANQINLGVLGGSITSDAYGGSISLSGFGGSILTNGYGGILDLSEHGGSITTGPYGGAINTTGQGSIELGSVTQGNPSGTAFGRTILKGSATGNSTQTITLPNATGTVALTNDVRFTDSRTPTAHTHAISDVTSLQSTLIAFAIALG